MESIEFLVMVKSMGFSMKSVAEFFGVNRKTAQRWATIQNPPSDVSACVMSMWNEWQNEITGILLEADSAPGGVVLRAYSDDVMCQVETGRRREQHTAFLGHAVMALSAGGFPWSITIA